MFNFSSLDEYRRHFGGALAADRFLPDAVRGFFENGGRRAVIFRLTGAGAQTARAEPGGVGLVANGPGAWGNRIFVKLSAATHRPAIRSRLQIADWDAPAPGGAYPDPFDPAQHDAVPQPDIKEDFDELDFADKSCADYYAIRLRDSLLLRLAQEDPGPLAAPPVAPLTPFAGGADGAAPAPESKWTATQSAPLALHLSKEPSCQAQRFVERQRVGLDELRARRAA